MPSGLHPSELSLSHRTCLVRSASLPSELSLSHKASLVWFTSLLVCRLLHSDDLRIYPCQFVGHYTVGVYPVRTRYFASIPSELSLSHYPVCTKCFASIPSELSLSHRACLVRSALMLSELSFSHSTCLVRFTSLLICRLLLNGSFLRVYKVLT